MAGWIPAASTTRSGLSSRIRRSATAGSDASACTVSTPVARSLDGSFFAALCIAISCPLCGLWLGAGSGAGWFAGETLDRLELVSRREVRVAQRHRDRLVAHELLHGAQIDAFHHEAAGERVSQIVPVEVLDPCFAERRHEDSAHEVLGVKWRPARLARKGASSSS